MHAEYVPISSSRKTNPWKWYHIAGLCAFALMAVAAVHEVAFRQPLSEEEVSIGNVRKYEPGFQFKEGPVALKLVEGAVAANKPRLFKVSFTCEPEQVEFVQHLITNVALLANTNREIPDENGQSETFLAYEAFASHWPVTSCEELFLLEAYPNAASEKIHLSAAYKNGLEIMQVLRGTKVDNGLPGFNFARQGLVKTFSCTAAPGDCSKEMTQLKRNLIKARQIEEEKEKENKAFTGGVQGTGFKKAKAKTPEKLIRKRESEKVKKKMEEVAKKPKKPVVKDEDVEDDYMGTGYTMSHRANVDPAWRKKRKMAEEGPEDTQMLEETDPTMFENDDDGDLMMERMAEGLPVIHHLHHHIIPMMEGHPMMEDDDDMYDEYFEPEEEGPQHKVIIMGPHPAMQAPQVVERVEPEMAPPQIIRHIEPVPQIIHRIEPAPPTPPIIHRIAASPPVVHQVVHRIPEAQQAPVITHHVVLGDVPELPEPAQTHHVIYGEAPELQELQGANPKFVGGFYQNHDQNGQ